MGLVFPFGNKVRREYLRGVRAFRQNPQLPHETYYEWKVQPDEFQDVTRLLERVVTHEQQLTQESGLYMDTFFRFQLNVFKTIQQDFDQAKLTKPKELFIRPMSYIDTLHFMDGIGIFAYQIENQVQQMDIVPLDFKSDHYFCRKFLKEIWSSGLKDEFPFVFGIFDAFMQEEVY